VATPTTAAEAAARTRLITVESYAVFLDLTGADTARSRTEITFTCHEPGAATFADLDPIALHTAELNGTPLREDALSQGRLRLTGLAARNSLTVDATVAVATTGRGLTSYTDPADGQRFILANCFPSAAPTVFCCFDQPDLRAKLSLIVTLPAGWTCVTNGEPLHHPGEGTAGAWYFSAAPGLRPFDFALVAGPYVTTGELTTGGAESVVGTDTDGETTLTIRCRPVLGRSAGLSRIAGIVAATLRYYERLLAVPCPFRKLDVVFVPELNVAAMQMPAVMYVNERLLQQAADPDESFVPVVLAHEAAHLWFGCLVDGPWWDDPWLAESLATYLSYAAATAVLGQPHAWADFAMTGQASAYQTDSLPSTEPLSSPVATTADALTRPVAITYSKGTSIIRQLGALIGVDEVHAGLHDYLTEHAFGSATATELTACWSRVSDTDLAPWAAEWLEQPGVNVLRPEIIVDPDGIITSLAIAQSPSVAVGGPLRTHRLTIGSYEESGGRLSRRDGISVTVRGAWTHVPELIGRRRPAAIIINDADLAYGITRFDPVSWRALVTTAMDVSDPLTEAMCWTMAGDMVQHAELDAAEFTALVSRRITAGGPAAGLAELLDRAVVLADLYTMDAARAGARRQLAAAALATAERGQPASHRQRLVARGYASAADSPAQLDLLRRWLDARSVPAGLVLDLELRARILATLAGRDLISDDDLAGYAAADPVSGDVVVARCTARRPIAAAKEAAWAAALAPSESQPARLARAHAEGFWVPGQEKLTSEFRARYFAEALPALRRGHDARTAQRLARALYPVTLADEATLEATDAALAGAPRIDPIGAILVEQREMLRRVMAARGVNRSASPC
jgi:aminopeptidase N